MGYRVVVIREASELTKHLTHMSGEPMHFWYRGVKDHKYDILPSAYLSPKFRDNSRQIEQDAVDKAKSKFNKEEEAANLKIDLDWLCYLQHYGTPTRLLDWTTKIETAVYFAFEDHVFKKVDLRKLPSIWVLN